MVPRRTRRRVVPHTFGNEETDILPELDKFNYIIAGKKFVTLAVFREGMINDEDLDIAVASCTGNLDQPYASYTADARLSTRSPCVLRFACARFR
jgi:hypothetical protein